MANIKMSLITFYQKIKDYFLGIKEGERSYLKLALGILTLSVIVWFFGKQFLTKKVFNYNFVQNLPGAENFLSLDKNNEKLEIGGLILKNKVTRFSLDKINKLDKIKVHLAYKPGQKEIKIGIRGSESDPFIYKSLYFDPLANLSWEKIEENGLYLYQKNKQFDSIKSFLNQIPSDKKIASYQVEANQLVPYLSFNKSEKENSVIDTPIRGNATAYILVNGGDLSIKVGKQDMNMYEGADVLNITLSLGEIKVSETVITDDGFTDKSKNKTSVQNGTINVNNAKAGVYKLEFKFDSPNSDSVITKIEINQPKVVFGTSVLVWNSTPTNFFTDSTKISASTSWSESIQNLKIDDKADLAIKDTKNKFNFDLVKIIKDKNQNDLYKINSPKGNINFGVDGYFSFKPESYFDPKIVKAQNLVVANNQADIKKNFDYVLTSLEPIKEENYWLVSDISLNASDYKLDGKKIYFSLEIPDLDKQGGSVEIGGMMVTLTTK